MAIVQATTEDLVVVKELHAGNTVLIDRAAGMNITLPAAFGSGDQYEFIVGRTPTSNNIRIHVANSSDTMVGQLETSGTTGATTNGFCEAAGGTDDTITMSGTTTGGIVGSRVVCRDIAVNLWQVTGFLIGSGTLASSLSAAV